MNISELWIVSLFHPVIDLWVVYPSCIGYRLLERHCNYCVKEKKKKCWKGFGKKMKKNAVFLHFF